MLDNRQIDDLTLGEETSHPMKGQVVARAGKREKLILSQDNKLTKAPFELVLFGAYVGLSTNISLFKGVWINK